MSGVTTIVKQEAESKAYLQIALDHGLLTQSPNEIIFRLMDGLAQIMKDPMNGKPGEWLLTAYSPLAILPQWI